MTPTSLAPEALRALESAPITQMLGGQIQDLNLEAGTLTTRYLAPESFMNPARQVQGGMLSAMLDDVTAVLVTIALVIPQLKRRLRSKRVPDAPKSL